MLNASLRITEVIYPDHLPIDLLLLADPSRKQIDQYVASGFCYQAFLDHQTAGIMVLKEAEPGVIEIMNLAVAESLQGRGIGKRLLREAEKISRTKGYERLRIATGNSSIGQLALYQKEGFEIVELEKDYFIHNYPQPIYEHGIRCRHRIILEKSIRSQ